MQRVLSPQPVLPAAWVDVLESVQQALVKAEADAAQREQAAATFGLPSERQPDHEVAWKQCLNRLDERSQAWQRRIQQAEREAGEGDTALQTGEAELRQWLTAAETAARRLVNWVAGGV